MWKAPYDVDDADDDENEDEDEKKIVPILNYGGTRSDIVYIV